MINDELLIDFEESTQLARLANGSNKADKGLIIVPSGFTLTDLHEALLATGYVRDIGNSLRLGDLISADQLADMVSGMLGLFAAPGVPTNGLLEVQTAVEDFQSGVESNASIPLMAIAWLDYIVRQDIADESRNSAEIWSKNKYVVETKAHKDLRIKQLVARYSRSTSAGIRRMTPSAISLFTEGATQSATG
jgi:hypothetical protein